MAGKCLFLKNLLFGGFFCVQELPDVLLGSRGFKGIVQSFELNDETRLIRSSVKNWRSGNFL
jgi:hypothetical protein